MSLHNAPVGFGIERGRHLVDQRRQIGGPADFAQLAAAVQFIGNSQQVNGDALFMQAGECIPDPFVAVDVKIVRAQKLGNIVIDFRINEYRPNDGFFGFSVVRDCRWRGGGGGVSKGVQEAGNRSFLLWFFRFAEVVHHRRAYLYRPVYRNQAFRENLQRRTDARSLPSDNGAGSLFSGSFTHPQAYPAPG